MAAVKAFFAGFLATIVFHQPMLFLLQLAGLTTRAPYAMQAVPPFGVPAVISLAFWGGVWGILLWLVIRRRSNSSYWTITLLFGAIAPTLVAGLVVAPLKHQATPRTWQLIVLGLAVNAAWGLGTAVFLRLFRAK
ncbi:MAG: hypothetical protein QOH21_2132 [Acidobacteriota bacterium]|jgi:hypothetical protein|nr:hypothetical protein [Acidobacteriota bacterium]